MALVRVPVYRSARASCPRSNGGAGYARRDCGVPGAISTGCCPLAEPPDPCGPRRSRIGTTSLMYVHRYGEGTSLTLCRSGSGDAAASRKQPPGAARVPWPCGAVPRGNPFRIPRDRAASVGVAGEHAAARPLGRRAATASRGRRRAAPGPCQRRPAAASGAAPRTRPQVGHQHRDRLLAAPREAHGLRPELRRVGSVGTRQRTPPSLGPHHHVSVATALPPFRCLRVELSGGRLKTPGKPYAPLPSGTCRSVVWADSPGTKP